MKAWADVVTTVTFPTSEIQATVSSDSKMLLDKILEIYEKVYEVMRLFGSSSFILEKSSDNSTQNSPKDSDSNLRLGYSTNTRFLLFYYGTKTVLVLDLIFYIIRFFNMISCKTKFCEDKGVLLLSITTYIWGLVMVLGIYIICHVKRSKICEFFGKLNQLDSIIFDQDADGRLQYIHKHWEVYNRVKIYFPIMMIISLVLIGMNHANHPRFLAHVTSLVLINEDDAFFSTWKTTCVTIFSFSLEFFLITYFYLALYQYLFMAIIVARCFNWCLQALTQRSKKLLLVKETQTRVKLVESAVEKFEHIRGLLNEYNEIFSGLLLFCKAIILIQITIMTYIPLKRMYILPFTSILIFFAMTLHYGIQVTILLYEMGRVWKASKQFPEFWLRNLLGGSQPGSDTIVELKILLDACTPFGFDCAGCYIVDTSTVLTFFSIVTSYLIVLFELQI